MKYALLAAGLGTAAALGLAAEPSPPVAMFGGDHTRNMVDLTAKDIPAEPKPDGPNMLWKADLGSRAYGGPVVAGGKVLCGTNNERPRNPRDTVKNADGDVEPVDRGVLMCFDAKTGAFQWQAVHNKLESGQVNDWPKEGVCATPTVEGDRVYYVSNRCVVECLDLNGRANGVQGGALKYKVRVGTTEPAVYREDVYDTANDADVLWQFDMMAKAAVFPHNMAAGCPLLVGDYLYTNTGNGVDEGHINIPSPEAPSFICLNKKTGVLVWRNNLPGKSIMHGQWSNPSYAEIGGVKQVIFPAGDGWIYALKPDTGDLIWKFDGNPKGTKYELGGTGTKSDFIGCPVLYDNKLYIGTGQDPEHFSGIAHFWCIDPSKAKPGNTDLTPKNNNFDPAASENKDSGLVWHYGGADDRKFVPRDFRFGRTMSTACVVDGVLYVSELQGYLHCLDAKTGKKFWQYDTKGSIWGSPYYVDGKVYLATEGGDLFVLKHDKQPQVNDELDIPGATDARDFNTKLKAKRKDVEKAVLLHKVEFDAPIRSTPVVADGVMYVMTEKSLYAFGSKK